MCRKQEDVTWAGSVAGNDPATPRPAGDRELSVPHGATSLSPVTSSLLGVDGHRDRRPGSA